jgi:hypothetical protein
MLTFVGYIPLRRGVLQHLQEGRITLQEFNVFVMLLIWANHKTGIASTNAAGLVFLSGGQLEQRYTQRCLASLEKKGYIKMPFFQQGQRGDYDIFIDKYVVTEGAYDGKVLSFAKTTDWKKPVYVDLTEDAAVRTADNAAEDAAEDAAGNADSNEKGEGRSEKGEVNKPSDSTEADRTEDQNPNLFLCDECGASPDACICQEDPALSIDALSSRLETLVHPARRAQLLPKLQEHLAGLNGDGSEFLKTLDWFGGLRENGILQNFFPTFRESAQGYSLESFLGVLPKIRERFRKEHPSSVSKSKAFQIED